MIAAVKWSRSNARSGSFSIQNRLLKRYSVKHLQLRSNWSSASRIAILASLVFLSGIGSLIFETLWLRLSGLTFGNSIWSAALILSSFMTGMALGNAFAASSRVQRWRPLRLYAFLELVIAFLGCTIVFGLPLLGEWLRPLFQTLWNYQTDPFRITFCSLIFSAVAASNGNGINSAGVDGGLFLQEAEFGRAIGILYGVNILGAVTGALLGEAYLVEAFGLLGTALTAGAATSTAAATALLVARRDGAAPPAAKPPLSLRLSITYRPPWRLLFVSFVTGGILLSVWKWSGSDSCACMSIVINRFLNNAGGCPRRDWPRRSRLWNDALPSGAIESVVTCAAAFRRNFNARLLRIFSGRDSSNKSKCFRHPGLAAGRPAFLCPDVPGRPHFGNHISAHRRARSNQRGRQNEQQTAG
ncbi:MAG: hypothetical protein DME43_01185 [Verrucomicrobia bacterium]|nr:MAG: hypothetical protein DME43_01185 [Verrucomicrobiota bacterium]